MKHAFVLAALMGGIAGAGCGGDAVPEVKTQTPRDTIGTLADTVTVLVPVSVGAQLYVEHDAPMLARSLGIIESVYVTLGTPVREGQLLARLESTDQEIALARAQEVSENANRALARLRALAESGYAAVADSEQARSTATTAMLALRQAQRDYDLTRITAPFDGVVTSRQARPRRLVSKGDSLFRVTAMSPLLASLRVPEASAGGVSPGASAEVETPDGGRVVGRVIQASPVIDAASGTREVIVHVPAHLGLHPGTSVTVRLSAERRTVIAIPRAAVRDQGYVVVWDKGRPVMRQVRLGADLPDGRVEVIAGLAVGERLDMGAPR